MEKLIYMLKNMRISVRTDDIQPDRTEYNAYSAINPADMAIRFRTPLCGAGVVSQSGQPAVDGTQRSAT